jgi:diacylglycerol kinase
MSLRHALRGVFVYIRTTPNFMVHLSTALIVAVLGAYFDLAALEWAMLVLANGLVIGAEAFNSAIEIDMNLTHEGAHPWVRDTKDLAAGAVLILGVTAWIVDILVFFPHVKALL